MLLSLILSEIPLKEHAARLDYIGFEGSDELSFYHCNRANKNVILFE